MQSKKLGKLVFAAGVAVVIGLGTLAVRSSEAAVRNLCGASILWQCTLPNGTQTLFGGTVCDEQKYEKSTGATCSPYTGG
jgi:hypothetical protein